MLPAIAVPASSGWSADCSLSPSGYQVTQILPWAAAFTTTHRQSRGREGGRGPPEPENSQPQKKPMSRGCWESKLAGCSEALLLGSRAKGSLQSACSRKAGPGPPAALRQVRVAPEGPRLPVGTQRGPWRSRPRAQGHHLLRGPWGVPCRGGRAAPRGHRLLGRSPACP